MRTPPVPQATGRQTTTHRNRISESAAHRSQISESAAVRGTAPVSRAENKLAGAVAAFHYDFRSKTVLDIGSSTGGFTEFALNHGAARVIAVEKGTNQMKAPLRFDPRVVLLEKTDIFDVSTSRNAPQDPRQNASQHQIQDILQNPATNIIDTPDTILADVSFISLKPVLAHARTHLADQNTDFLVMLKPQFEAEPRDLHKGVVKNDKIRRGIIKNFESWLKQNHFLIIDKRDNTLAGRTGNLERFYYLKIAKI